MAALAPCLAACAVLVMALPLAYGHGIGTDTTQPIPYGDSQVRVAVDIPSYADEADTRQVTLTVTDAATGDPVPDITLDVRLSKGGQLVLDEQMAARDGTVSFEGSYADQEASVTGQRGGSGELEPGFAVAGRAFDPGLHTFEIAAGGTAQRADVTIVESARFGQQDLQGEPVGFGTRSYYDSVSSLVYDPEMGRAELVMPFDWSEQSMSHVPVVHVEVKFPSSFDEFFAPGYNGTANGVPLFKSSISVDDYTSEGERTVHFILLNDHIRHAKTQLSREGADPGGQLVLVLTATGEAEFPVSAWTRDEQFQVDMSWDPAEIVPGQDTKFVFTIRDAATAEPLRRSAFDFVILQNEQELYRERVNAQVGGGFADYRFEEGQTGHTVVRFEDIRGSGQSTEFGIVVVPEFGILAPAMLAAGMASVAAAGRYLHRH